MSKPAPSTLVIGYGNPARGDDGLGPALVESIGAADLEAVSVRTAMQLQIEDAAELARHSITVFVDADASCPAPFAFRQLKPDPATGIGTHAVHPAALLAVAHDVYGTSGEAYVLAIRGGDFEMFDERISPDAIRHLAAAEAFLVPLLRDADRARQLAWAAARSVGERVEAETS